MDEIPEAGTLLQLSVLCEGDEARMIEALQNGYQLTGNFRGREHLIMDELGLTRAPAVDEIR